jgi:hypothetical protein
MAIDFKDSMLARTCLDPAASPWSSVWFITVFLFRMLHMEMVNLASWIARNMRIVSTILPIDSPR